ncbi:MAG: hypothetical protein HYU60_00155 [Magnetospirillum sp.]|nr:hypothetical protein [Magnetospirillum sp.]
MSADSPDTDEDRLLISLIDKLDGVSERRVLLESIELMMRLLYRRPKEQNAAPTISGLMEILQGLGSASTAEDLANAGHRCSDLLRKLLGREKAAADAPPPSAAAPVTPPAAMKTATTTAADDDISYEVPEHLAYLLKRISYELPQPAAPVGNFGSFDELCEAAVMARVDSVLVFFQRRNPEIQRALPPPFLLSPEFAENFRKAVSRFVLPAIRGSRQIRMQATSFKWEEATTDSFWDHTSRQLKEKLQQVWIQAWCELKLIETRKPDGTKVFQVKSETKGLREMLQPPHPDTYDLPKIGNRELDVFCSLLDPATDWFTRLSDIWQTCHDLYEQEKDPRVFQDRAREGALRDNLLTAFQRFPDQWADFLVLTCHRVFPRVNCAFIEKFTTNVGSTDAERERHLPFVMRYLYQVKDNPEISVWERKEENDWVQKAQELRRWLRGDDDDQRGDAGTWKKKEPDPRTKVAESWIGQPAASKTEAAAPPKPKAGG